MLIHKSNVIVPIIIKNPTFCLLSITSSINYIMQNKKDSLKYIFFATIGICIGYFIYDYTSDGVMDAEPIPMLVIIIGSSLALFSKK